MRWRVTVYFLDLVVWCARVVGIAEIIFVVGSRFLVHFGLPAGWECGNGSVECSLQRFHEWEVLSERVVLKASDVGNGAICLALAGDEVHHGE